MKLLDNPRSLLTFPKKNTQKEEWINVSYKGIDLYMEGTEN